jgi:hypothetical protein
MKVFSIDVRMVATAYIRAETHEAAVELVQRQLHETGLDLEVGYMNDVPISGLQYHDPELPEVSLSPAMTIVGPADDDALEMVEDLTDDEDDDE